MRLFPRFSPFLLLLAASLAPADETQITLMSGRNGENLGDEDPRYGFAVGLSVLREEPRFGFGTFRGQVKYEASVLFSSSGGTGQYDADRTEGYGAMALYRLSRYRRGAGIFAEVGIGLQYSTQATYDAPLQLNTTPTGGLGYRFESGGRAFELGVRLFHVSNGGRKPPNGGQNWILYTLSVGF